MKTYLPRIRSLQWCGNIIAHRFQGHNGAPLQIYRDYLSPKVSAVPHLQGLPHLDLCQELEIELIGVAQERWVTVPLRSQFLH